MNGYHPKIEVDYGGIIAVVRQTEILSPLEAVRMCDAVINSLVQERRRILTADINLAKSYEQSLTWPNNPKPI